MEGGKNPTTKKFRSLFLVDFNSINIKLNENQFLLMGFYQRRLAMKMRPRTAPKRRH